MSWERERTLVLGETLDDLDDQLDDLADTMVDEEPDEGEEPSEAFRDAVQDGQRLNRQHVGVSWAVDEWGADAEVVVSAIDMGSRAEVDDYKSSLRSNTVGGPSSSDGAGRLFYIAAGVAEAPFADRDDGIEETVAELRSVPQQFGDWLEEQINEVSTPDVSGNEFGERLEARRNRTSATNSE